MPATEPSKRQEKQRRQPPVCTAAAEAVPVAAGAGPCRLHPLRQQHQLIPQTSHHTLPQTEHIVINYQTSAMVVQRLDTCPCFGEHALGCIPDAHVRHRRRAHGVSIDRVHRFASIQTTSAHATHQHIHCASNAYHCSDNKTWPNPDAAALQRPGLREPATCTCASSACRHSGILLGSV